VNESVPQGFDLTGALAFVSSPQLVQNGSTDGSPGVYGPDDCIEHPPLSPMDGGEAYDEL